MTGRSTVRGGVAAALLAGLATPAAVLPLDLPPGAELARAYGEASTSHALPIGAATEGWLPSEMMNGDVTFEVWRLDAHPVSTHAIIAPLIAQIEAAGWQILFECETRTCGGFDFRRLARVMPPPEMHVDLGDFRFASARKDDAGLSLLVSRTAQAGFVQITRIGDAAVAGPAPDDNTPEVPPAPMSADVPLSVAPVIEIAARLEGEGRVILTDLSFETGSAELAVGDYPSLVALAAYLAANPGRQVALVGHTDSSGSLELNIALSRQRAGSVLEKLVRDYGVDRAQLRAEGMGYLAPVATNLTDAGREANRRVEAILISTE
ncbi:MAG: OmpA family protein [Rubellimicrobium sp.]|nr:OmpA family protein [Rubellimicrobium sp.]